MGALSGVWGSGPDDVFVVGGTADAAEVYHFDGADWSPHDAPALPLLVWSTGFGPDDVYAVGVGGGAAHWDGAAWTVLDTGVDTDLWGVFGFASDDLWVVGGDVDAGDPTLLHWDGAAFTAFPVDPAENPMAASALFKVWGIDGHLWAVGQGGLILAWDGAAWTRQPAGPEADQDFVSLWGTSADRVVAVGGRGNARIATWDGAAWTTVAPSGVGGLNGVFLHDAHRATVCGTNAFVATLDVDSGALDVEEPAGNTELHAVWGDGQRTYVVGGQFRAPFTGLAMVKEGR